MTDTTPSAAHPLHDLPLFGWIARRVSEDTDSRIFFALVLLIVLVAVATAIWGVVALGLIALVSVPLMFVVLLLLTIGR